MTSKPILEIVLDMHGVHGLTRNLLIEQLIDSSNKVSGKKTEPKKKEPKKFVYRYIPPMCKEHYGQKKNLYCRSCQGFGINFYILNMLIIICWFFSCESIKMIRSESSRVRCANVSGSTKNVTWFLFKQRSKRIWFINIFYDFFIMNNLFELYLILNCSSQLIYF